MGPKQNVLLDRAGEALEPDLDLRIGAKNYQKTGQKIDPKLEPNQEALHRLSWQSAGLCKPSVWVLCRSVGVI